MQRRRMVWALVAGAALLTGCGSMCPEISQTEKKTFLTVRPEEGGYTIQAGDRLQVEVWQNQQLTRSVTVRPDGKITLPLVNDVAARGDTVPQFQKRLTARLKTYIKDPLVSITVTQFSSKRIYMLGQIRRPGSYPYAGQLSLLQALTLAEGATPFAEGCAIVVRRKGEGYVRYKVELGPITSGESLKENINLQPEDVVTVQ